MKAHKFKPLPKARRSTVTIPWPVCVRCGLMLLKNDASRKAERKPCGGLEDE